MRMKDIELAKMESLVEYDFLKLHEINNKINNNIIDLNPSFQRENRWTDIDKSKLIESIILNIPIPPIFLKVENNKLVVIDGKQRLNTISQFLNNQHTLNDLEYEFMNEKSFSDLEQEAKEYFYHYNLLCIIINDNNKEIGLKKYFGEIFRRINTGGVNLTNHEIRIAIYGKNVHNEITSKIINSNNLNDIFNNEINLNDISEYILKTFYRRKKNKFNIYIKDLDDFYIELTKNDVLLDDLIQEFNVTIKYIIDLFGDKSFRLYKKDAERNIKYYSDKISYIFFQSLILAINIKYNEIVIKNNTIIKENILESMIVEVLFSEKNVEDQYNYLIEILEEKDD